VGIDPLRHGSNAAHVAPASLDKWRTGNSLVADISPAGGRIEHRLFTRGSVLCWTRRPTPGIDERRRSKPVQFRTIARNSGRFGIRARFFLLLSCGFGRASFRKPCKPFTAADPVRIGAARQGGSPEFQF